MTNLEAIQHYIEPYEVSEGKLELLLAEQGLQAAFAYDAMRNKRPMYRAIIAALWSLITLAKEKDNGSEIAYDVDAIRDLIKHYQQEIGDPISKPKNRDISHRW